MLGLGIAILSCPSVCRCPFLHPIFVSSISRDSPLLPFIDSCSSVRSLLRFIDVIRVFLFQPTSFRFVFSCSTFLICSSSELPFQNFPFLFVYLFRDVFPGICSFLPSRVSISHVALDIPVQLSGSVSSFFFFSYPPISNVNVPFS